MAQLTKHAALAKPAFKLLLPFLEFPQAPGGRPAGSMGTHFGAQSRHRLAVQLAHA